MSLLKSIKDRMKKNAPALAMAGMGCALVASMATGQVSAVENETAEVVKYFGLTILNWAAVVMTVIFGAATLLFRDFRVAILTVVMMAISVLISYGGL